MKGIADTGFIVAFGNRGRQPSSLGRRSWRETITEPLLTCEAVWPRPHFIWDQVPMFSPWYRMRCFGSRFDCNRNLEQLRDLARRYRRS